jgi:hypothetical protein
VLLQSSQLSPGRFALRLGVLFLDSNTELVRHRERCA